MIYPQTKTVCQLDSQGVYIGTTEADLSPLEAEQGIYLLPANSIDVDPPQLVEGQAAKWIDDNWVYMADYRGMIIYSTIDKHKRIIDFLGDIPDGYTQLKPLDGGKWDGKKWIVSEKYKATLIKEKARNLIDYLANKTDQLKSSLLVGYPQTEIDSFYRQEKEALAWKDNHNTPTPMLTQIGKLRGVPFELLVEKVLEKSNQFAFVIGEIIGKRQHFEDDILKAETLEQLAEIEQEIEKWTL